MSDPVSGLLQRAAERLDERAATLTEKRVAGSSETRARLLRRYFIEAEESAEAAALLRAIDNIEPLYPGNGPILDAAEALARTITGEADTTMSEL